MALRYGISGMGQGTPGARKMAKKKSVKIGTAIKLTRSPSGKVKRTVRGGKKAPYNAQAEKNRRQEKYGM